MNENDILDAQQLVPDDNGVSESTESVAPDEVEQEDAADDLAADQEDQEDAADNLAVDQEDQEGAADDLAAHQEDQEGVEDGLALEFPEFSPENPLPVQIIDPEQPEEEFIEPFALSGTYRGTIGSQYLEYFTGIVQKLPYDVHYVVWRSGQYAYTMAYGSEVELNGSRFTGNCEKVEIYRSGSNYDNDWVVRSGSDRLSLSTSDLFVYSDLGMYPTLERGLNNLEGMALLFSVGFAVVFVVCHDIFTYVLRGFRR